MKAPIHYIIHCQLLITHYQLLPLIVKRRKPTVINTLNWEFVTLYYSCVGTGACSCMLTLDYISKSVMIIMYWKGIR